MGKGYESLAAFTQQYWWWLAADLLAAAWCFSQFVLGRDWTQSALKLVLALNAVVIACLYFISALTPALTVRAAVPFLNTQIASQTMTFLYLVTAMLLLLDAFLSRTRLSLPQRPRSRWQILVGCSVGLLFPAFELLGGQILPRAQAFGDGPAAFVLFTAVLLGGSRPDTWVGRLLLIFVVALSVESGLLAAVFGGHWQYLPVFLAAAMALLYGLRRRRMVALKSSR
jgi:hypothetical protein